MKEAPPMRWIWRRTIHSLLVASTFGGLVALPCPAPADEVLPPIGQSTPRSALPPRAPATTTVDSTPVETPPVLPIVVPPRTAAATPSAPTTQPAARPRGVPIAGASAEPK